MNQPLNMPRNTGFIPPSKYYGDRYARTMTEAFGPYAELSPAEPTHWERQRGYVLTALLALWLVAVSWNLHQ